MRVYRTTVRTIEATRAGSWTRRGGGRGNIPAPGVVARPRGHAKQKLPEKRDPSLKKNEQTNDDAEKGPKRGWGAIDGFHLEALRAKPNDASVM